MERNPAIEALRGAAARRDYVVSDIEVRADGEGDIVNFSGHASVTDRAYPMYGGAEAGFPGFDETVARGAFKKTLSETPDVAFLVNHGGMTLARTKAGTLNLREDRIGLAVDAQLDTRVSIVNDLTLLMASGAMDEMSFAFRVVKDHWTNDAGEEVAWWDDSALYRTIQEVSLSKGDVSVVNYGANPYTSASLRDLAGAFSMVATETDIRAAVAELSERLPVTISVPPPVAAEDILAALEAQAHPTLDEWRARFLRHKYAA